MAPTLIAIAGPSRSGKGTCASIFTEGAQDLGLTVRERQLSGPGKQYVASAWRPKITEEEAVAWFDEMKEYDTRITIDASAPLDERPLYEVVPLQQYLQRMLQGARDRWGTDFWTDKLIPPLGAHLHGAANPLWCKSFSVPVDEQFYTIADLCLISDLRQVNEAERVKALGGHIVEMRRPEIEHAYVTGADHVTEKRLSDIRPDLVDYIIIGHAQHNNETFDLLKSDCVKAWLNFVRPIIERTTAA